jgi:hypothetical protein
VSPYKLKNWGFGATLNRPFEASHIGWSKLAEPPMTINSPSEGKYFAQFALSFALMSAVQASRTATNSREKSISVLP